MGPAEITVGYEFIDETGKLVRLPVATTVLRVGAAAMDEATHEVSVLCRYGADLRKMTWIPERVQRKISRDS